MIYVIVLLLLVIVPCILSIYFRIKRNKKSVEQLPKEENLHERVGLIKAIVQSLAGVVGFLMLLGYFILKSEGIKLEGIIVILYFVIALVLIALYRKVMFRFKKTSTNMFGFHLIAENKHRSHHSVEKNDTDEN